MRRIPDGPKPAQATVRQRARDGTRGRSRSKGGAPGSMISQSRRASSAEPRRSAKPRTLISWTLWPSATVTTSPTRTARLDACTRSPLTRTCPDVARAAAP